MAAYYKKQGKSLLDVMDELYNEFGFYRNRLLNYEFEGEAGMRIMNSIMDRLREDSPKEIAGDKVLTASDYKLSVQKNLTDGTESICIIPFSKYFRSFSPPLNRIIPYIRKIIHHNPEKILNFV